MRPHPPHSLPRWQLRHHHHHHHHHHHQAGKQLHQAAPAYTHTHTRALAHAHTHHMWQTPIAGRVSAIAAIFASTAPTSTGARPRAGSDAYSFRAAIHSSAIWDLISLLGWLVCSGARGAEERGGWRALPLAAATAPPGVASSQPGPLPPSPSPPPPQ